MRFGSTLFVAALVVLSFGAFRAIHAQENETAQAEKYIKLSESQWAEAEITRDYSVAERILADDFVGVAPDGSHYTKAQEMTRTKASSTEFVSNKTAEITVRFFGDAAVAQGSENWVKKNGQRQLCLDRYLDSARWKVASRGRRRHRAPPRLTIAKTLRNLQV